MPSRLAFESRPLRTDPWPFLCAIVPLLKPKEGPAADCAVGPSVGYSGLADQRKAALLLRLRPRGLDPCRAVHPLHRRLEPDHLRRLHPGVGEPAEVEQ